MGQCNKFFRLLPGFMQRFEKIHVWLEAKKDFRMQASGSPGGGWWIRTTEGVASRFTVCPLWPLGKSPIYEVWSWWTDSNPRPADYKSAALPAELYQHLSNEQVVYYQTSIRLSTGNLKKGGILLYAGKRHHDSVHAVCSLCAQDIYAGETLWYRNGVTVCADCFPRFAREALRSFEYILGEASTL